MSFKKTASLTMAIFSATLTAPAQDSHPVSAAEIYYPYNKTIPDTGGFKILQEIINAANAPGNSNITIKISGFSSPNGNSITNEENAKRRAENIYMYLEREIPGATITIDKTESDWGGLKQILSETPYPFSEDIINIIDNTPVWVVTDGHVTDSRIARIRRHDNGHAYRTLTEEVFPKLNRVQIEYSCTRSDTIPKTIVPTSRDTVTALVKSFIQDAYHQKSETACDYINETSLPLSSEKGKEKKPYIPYFRTNLFLPLLNAGLELPIGNRMSFGLDINAPWLGTFDNGQHCLELTALETDLKLRFGKKERAASMLGPYVGICAVAGHYDLCYDGKGQQGEAAGSGLELGWAFRLGKNGVRLELEAGAGVLYHRFLYYSVSYSGQPIREESVKHVALWTGPMRAGCRLCLPLNRNVR